MAFSYYSPISINSAQVPSTQTDFPVLVNLTDARFKTVGNSGHVQNSSGFDIRPYTDSTLVTAITGYELERYNASTGEVVMWVKVSSLTSSSTPFVLAYGDSGISTDGSSTSAWDSNFKGVWHLKDGTTLSTAESTASNKVLSFTNTPTATSGQIDGAGNFASASSQKASGALDISAFTAITFSSWVNATSFPNAYNTVGVANISTRFVELYVKSTGKIAIFIQNPAKSYDGTGSHTLSTSTWYLLHLTYDSTQGLIGYVNGASDGTASAGTALSIAGMTSVPADLANDSINAGRGWNGKLDEVRISNVARSANWIATEYNNQSAPGTFETLGTEVSTGLGGSTSNMFLVM